MTGMKAMVAAMTTRHLTVVPDESRSARTPGLRPDGPPGRQIGQMQNFELRHGSPVHADFARDLAGEAGEL
jgi:hypothetical protein